METLSSPVSVFRSSPTDLATSTTSFCPHGPETVSSPVDEQRNPQFLLHTLSKNITAIDAYLAEVTALYTAVPSVTKERLFDLRSIVVRDAGRARLLLREIDGLLATRQRQLVYWLGETASENPSPSIGMSRDSHRAQPPSLKTSTDAMLHSTMLTPTPGACFDRSLSKQSGEQLPPDGKDRNCECQACSGSGFRDNSHLAVPNRQRRTTGQHIHVNAPEPRMPVPTNIQPVCTSVPSTHLPFNSRPASRASRGMSTNSSAFSSLEGPSPRYARQHENLCTTGPASAPLPLAGPSRPSTGLGIRGAEYRPQSRGVNAQGRWVHESHGLAAQAQVARPHTRPQSQLQPFFERGSRPMPYAGPQHSGAYDFRSLSGAGIERVANVDLLQRQLEYAQMERDSWKARCEGRLV